MPSLKKTKSASKVENLESTHVEAPVVETPIVTLEPVVEQTAGAKKTKKSKQAVVEPTVAVEPSVEVAPVVKGKKAKKVATPEVSTEVAPVAPVTPKVKKTKAAKETVTSPEVVALADEVVEDTKTRSFKVQLPGLEKFSGRFTGLTPYQAANKALSKYFRNKENVNLSDANITFSIIESTRGSKRNTYTYRGNRTKLETPITYTIKSATGEERVITKQFKNQLIKVKKNITTEEVAPAAA